MGSWRPKTHGAAFPTHMSMVSYWGEPLMWQSNHTQTIAPHIDLQEQHASLK